MSKNKKSDEKLAAFRDLDSWTDFYLSVSSRIRISGSSEAEHVVLGASFGSRPNLGTLERGRSQARTWWSTSGTSTRGSPVQVSVLPASLTATRTRSCCWKLLICSSSPPTQKNSLCVFVLLDDDDTTFSWQQCCDAVQFILALHAAGLHRDGLALLLPTSD